MSISVRIIDSASGAKYFSEPKDFVNFLKTKDGYANILLFAIENCGRNLSKLQKFIDVIYTHAECFQDLEFLYANCNMLIDILVIDFTRVRLPSLKRLTTTHVRVVGIERISAQLTDVCLIHAYIDEFPRAFHSELSSLTIRNNSKLLNIDDISMYKELTHVTICSNNLSVVPILPNTGQLTYLDVSMNQITEIKNLPNSIKQLYINTNRIRSIDAFPTSVHFVNMWENPLRRFPENLLLCRSLYLIHFYETEIEMTAMEMRFLEDRTNYRPLERMTRGRTADVYTNTQNVHCSSIQKSFLKSCQNLLLDKVPDQAFTGTGNVNVDRIIREFSKNCERHCILYITFGELFQKVWNRIATQGDKNIRAEQIKRLREEMLDAESKCFMGQITRMLNVLVGFYEDICIEIEESEQIYAKIQANRVRNNNVVNVEELVAELTEINISKDIINEWVSACSDLQ